MCQRVPITIVMITTKCRLLRTTSLAGEEENAPPSSWSLTDTQSSHPTITPWRVIHMSLAPLNPMPPRWRNASPKSCRNLREHKKRKETPTYHHERMAHIQLIKNRVMADAGKRQRYLTDHSSTLEEFLDDNVAKKSHIPPDASSPTYQNSSLAAQLGNKNGSNASHQMTMGRYGDVSMLLSNAMQSKTKSGMRGD